MLSALSGIRPPIVDNRTKPKNLFEGYDFMEGFQDSEFYKKANWMQQDAVEFKFDGKDMMMNSSMAGALRQYLDSIGKGDLIQSNLVNSGPLQPLPEGLQIGYGPIKGGFFNNDGTKFTGDNPLLKPGLGPRDPNFYPSRPEMNLSSEREPSIIGGPGPDNIANKPLPYEFDNIGIGSLTQNPINTTPESSITGSIGSPYLNNNQDLDQYLNSYVENLINRRMRDIFGGIMSIFQ
jgi:hypothetical protein